jgi:hypothetical protein
MGTGKRRAAADEIRFQQNNLPVQAAGMPKAKQCQLDHGSNNVSVILDAPL